MHLWAYLMLFAMVGLATSIGYAFHSLLKAAQGREDADDEQLWQYLLDPRSL